MVLPRFTIRTALIGITACSLIFLVVGMAVRGDNWAWGFTIGVLSLAVTAVVHAAWFGMVWLFARLPSEREMSEGGVMGTVSHAVRPPAEPDSGDRAH